MEVDKTKYQQLWDCCDDLHETLDLVATEFQKELQHNDEINHATWWADIQTLLTKSQKLLQETKIR